MTSEEIIRMAREAGVFETRYNPVVYSATPETLERFAALVAAAEREALAQFFQDHWREKWTDLQIAEAIRARGQE